VGGIMKAKVTEKGVIIPKKLLNGADEVDIRKENNLVVITPKTKDDPILEFGKNPVSCGVSDASVQHDKYIYGSSQ
jgi:virulence-associated protein VagC